MVHSLGGPIDIYTAPVTSAQLKCQSIQPQIRAAPTQIYKNKADS